MPPPKLNVKTSALIVGAAAGIISAIVGYFFYQKRRTKQIDDTDEGIGDVDSIISEGEIEEDDFPAQLVATSRNKKTESDAAAEALEAISEDEELSDQSIEVLKPRKVLVLGLDRCGKSSMLNILARQPESGNYDPTKGFNAVQIEKGGVALSIMEVGGGSATRSYWKNFTNDTSLLIYLVDGADVERHRESKSELKKLLDQASFKNIDCLLISNKQDLPNALKADQIFTTKYINNIGMKGISNITLLNTATVSRENGSSDGELIMDVIVGLLKEKK